MYANTEQPQLLTLILIEAVTSKPLHFSSLKDSTLLANPSDEDISDIADVSKDPRQAHADFSNEYLGRGL